ncbi:FAD-dependent oxidoreductase [Actinoplanes sp. NPDC051470]|uniref:FAD-dependent oxidoreductase n=1 Tax=unclassified Actinoplanes TaxID=2626549 RepID=UPI003448DF1C
MPSAAATFAEISDTTPPPGTPARLGTAVVLGGSMAGLLAARVLADHADTVLIIERDEVSGAEPRQGVPQGSQVHALLEGGKLQLERWFPGFADRAVAAGAVRVPTQRMVSYSLGVPKVAGADLDLLTSTRPFLESRVRAELAQVPNVKVITGRVTGLEFGATAVTGVRLETGREPADLVVDAMGRASNVSGWLAEAGWDKPPMTRVTTGINYATAFFRRPPGGYDVDLGLAFQAPDAFLRGANFTPIEGDRYIMMVAGVGDDRPGRTVEDMVRRCRTELPEPFGVVASGEVVRDVLTYRQADSRRRDYTACERLPARLVPVGDAVASFNPIYGQGMSSAALHASCLAKYLRTDPDLDAPARAFLELQRVVVDAAWGISTSGDGAEVSWLGRLRRRMVQQVVEATTTDREVNKLFQAVMQMEAHPTVLARPDVLWRSFRARGNPLPPVTPSLVDERGELRREQP